MFHAFISSIVLHVPPIFLPDFFIFVTSRNMWDFHCSKNLSRGILVTSPPSGVVGYQRFKGPCCLHLHFTLKIEVGGSSETSVYYYNTTRCHNPEDQDANLVVWYLQIIINSTPNPQAGWTLRAARRLTVYVTLCTNLVILHNLH